MPNETDASLHAKGDEVTLKPEENVDAISALDALAHLESEGEPIAGNEAADAAKKAAEEKAAADKAAADKAEADKLAAEAAAGQTEEEKAAAAKAATDKVAADKAAADKAAAEADPFDKIELPPHVKPKSAESFNNLKKLAKETTAALRQQLAEAEAKRVEAESKAAKAAEAGPIPAETVAELEELRKFRLSKDVESDPEFLKFDAKHKANVENIYKKLEASGFSAESIAKIKEIGGPDAIDWEPILPKLNSTTRRFVEAVLVENVKLVDDREAALAKAKENAGTFVKEREEREAAQLIDTANGFLRNLPWSAQKEIPATATLAERTELEASNKFAREAVALLQTYLSDSSPARRAELAIGTLIAHRQKAELDAANTKLATITKDRDDKVAAITKERDTIKAELDAIKRAQVPRSRGDAIVPPKAKVNGVIVSGAEALDALHAEEIAAQD